MSTGSDDPLWKNKAGWQRAKRIYGVDEETFRRLAGQRCYICERVWSGKVRPCIDHDHVARRVRSVICIHCNLKQVGDMRDPEIAKRVWQYLSDNAWLEMPPKPKRKRKSTKSKRTPKGPTKSGKSDSSVTGTSGLTGRTRKPKGQ